MLSDDDSIQAFKHDESKLPVAFLTLLSWNDRVRVCWVFLHLHFASSCKEICMFLNLSSESLKSSSVAQVLSKALIYQNIQAVFSNIQVNHFGKRKTTN